MNLSQYVGRYVLAIPGIFLLAVSGSVFASGTIVQTAARADNLTTLVKAIEAAGLAETLAGTGPFTVFAPTDSAFAKLPADRLEALLSDRAALTELLSYHVVPGRLSAADLSRLSRLETAQGQSIDVNVGVAFTVDDATIVATDIVASNGIVHVIDAVMLPLGTSVSQHYDLMDPDIYLVAPDRLPSDLYNQIYGQ